MGISFIGLHLLSQTLPKMGDLSNKKILTLGNQDCYFTYNEVKQFLEKHKIPFKTPSEIMLTTSFKWSPSKENMKYIHQKTLFTMLGFSPENIHSMDVNDFEGADVIHDLNVPIKESLRSGFDFIFDSGTSEHVFSVKDVFFNIVGLCKKGGIVAQFLPVDMINHGFVNFNAEIFEDFYDANGFEKIELKYILSPTHPSKINHHYLEFAPGNLLGSMHPYYHTGVYSVFKKCAEKECVIPIQGYYRKLYVAGAANNSKYKNKILRFLAKHVRSWVYPYLLPSAFIHIFANLKRGRKTVL